MTTINNESTTTMSNTKKHHSIFKKKEFRTKSHNEHDKGETRQQANIPEKEQSQKRNENHNTKKQPSCSEHDSHECCKEYIEGWKRANADFENYKKRQTEEQREARERAKEEFLLELLPIVDNVEAAFKSIPETMNDNPWVQGIRFIKQQFETYLAEQGLKPIETEHEEFEEQYHEAIEMNSIHKQSIDSNVKKDKQQNHNNTRMMIEKEVRKGYMIGEKVLRPARVTVKKEQ